MFSPPVDQLSRSGFDEYVVGATSAKPSMTAAQLFLICAGGLCLALGILFSRPIFWTLFLKWTDYSAVFDLAEFSRETPEKIPMGYYAWGLIYNSWALPIGLLTLSALLFSAFLITGQIQQDQFNSQLAHMPAVFIRPRLKWTSITVEGNNLQAEPPRLSIDLLNVGETPAIRLQLHVAELYLNTRSSTRWSRHVSKINLELVHDDDKDAYYARLVPADHDGRGDGGVTENLVRTHSFRVPAPLQNANGSRSLLQSLLSSSVKQDFPALVLVLNVRFETIRRVQFDETIVVRWSARTCRTAANPLQRGQIDDLSATVEENDLHGWKAHQPPYNNGKPQDLSSWTWLTLSPKVANKRTGGRLMWGDSGNRLDSPGEVQ
jgi:hypothetical protein